MGAECLIATASIGSTTAEASRAFLWTPTPPTTTMASQLVTIDTAAPTLSITTPISGGYINNAEDESSLSIGGTSSSPDGGSRIDSVEVVDLTGTGNNTLKLTAHDVLDMAGLNIFASTGRHQLLVKGDVAGDTIDLADGSGTTGWTQSGTISYGGTTYNTWNHDTILATLYVGQNTSVI